MTQSDLSFEWIPLVITQGTHYSRTKAESGRPARKHCSCPGGDCNGSDQGQQSGGEKWVDSGSVLKAEPQDLLMDWMRDGRERTMKTLRVLGLIVGKMELPLTSGRKTVGRGCLGGYQDLALDLSSLKCPSDTRIITHSPSFPSLTYPVCAMGR